MRIFAEDEVTELDDILRCDGLAQAETITGKSYKEDKETEALGLALIMGNARERDNALSERGDTTLHNKLSYYLDVIQRLGFEEVYREAFVSRWNKSECFFVFATKDGILLEFDTFDGTSINGGKYYYNWLHSPAMDFSDAVRLISSGHWSDNVLVGYHDAREAIVHYITRFRNLGTMLSPWRAHQTIWLMHHGDEERYPECMPLIRKRLEKLPTWVFNMISYDSSHYDK